MTDTEALFAEYQPRLFRYLYRAVGQADAARDLTQEVFLRAVRAPVPERGDDEIRAWLFRVARNLAIDHHRQQARRSDPRQAAGQLDAHPASQETVLAVNEALAALTDIDRDVFLLREVAGLGYDEIATACDLTPDAVRSRIHRARLHLRDLLSASIRARRSAPLRQTGHRHD